MNIVNTIDKRHFSRKRFNLPIKLKADCLDMQGQLLDLSRTGALISLDELSFKEGDNLSIELSSSISNVPAKIVRIVESENNSCKAYKVGLSFENTDKIQTENINKILKVKDVNNIGLFTLDCIYSAIAVNKLVKTFPHKFSFICLSIPYSKKKGSFLAQTLKNFKKSGSLFVFYLSLYLYAHKFFVKILNFFQGNRKEGLVNIKELAKQYNIPLLVTNDINCEKTIQLIKNLNPNLIISTHLDQKISKDILNIPKYGAINLHYAKLPAYRGPFPNFWALSHDCKTVGVSIHYMTDRLDEGDVIQQEEIVVQPDDSIISLDAKLFDMGADLIIRVIEKMELDVLTSVKQDHLGVANYYSYPKRKEIKTILGNKKKIINFNHYFKALSFKFNSI